MRRLRTYLLLGAVILSLVVIGVVVLALQSERPSSATSDARSLPIDAPHFRQDDPAWASASMGESGQAMGQWGCTVTCLAMGLSALGSPMNPAEVCARLNETGGFTEDGLVIWGAVSEITDGDFEVEAPGLDYGAINTELAEGRPVIAKIILPEGIQHWVLIVGRDSGEYRALNPASEDATPMRLSEDAEDIKAIRLFVRR